MVKFSHAVTSIYSQLEQYTEIWKAPSLQNFNTDDPAINPEATLR